MVVPRTQMQFLKVTSATDRIRCKECGQWFTTITGSHLRTHGMTVDEYRQEFNVDFLVPEGLRIYQSKSRRRSKGLGTYVPLDRRGIMNEIRRIDRQDGALDLETVRHRRSPLLRLAVKVFGTWRAAVNASGVDYEAHMRFARWDPRRVVAHIRDRRRGRESLQYRDVERENCGLLNAARRYWGSWNDALREAGVDPDTTSAVRKWTRRDVLEEIRAADKKRMALNAASIRAEKPSLLSAARRRFGSWDASLEAAGLDPAAIRKTHEWSRELVVAEIKRRRRARRPLNVAVVRDENSGFAWAARKYFGSWDKALEAAGLDPSTVRLRAPRAR